MTQQALIDEQQVVRLTRPKGRNAFCGPVALSAVLQVTSHYASKALREITKKSQIKGVKHSEMCKALSYFGCTYIVHEPRKSVGEFIQDMPEGQVFILGTKDHYIATDGIRWCDNGWWGKGRKLMTLGSLPNPREKVEHAYRIVHHRIVEPDRPKSQGTPESFTDLYYMYENGSLESEMDMVKSWVGERMKDSRGEDWPVEPYKAEDYFDAYVEDHGTQVIETDGTSSLDRYLWEIFCEVAEDRWEMLDEEGQQAVRTIRMLNGKYKLIRTPWHDKKL